MSESNLNKEFNKKDVQRMRNLITKKYGDATSTQIGYQKQTVEHNEGDIWEENGKQWTIKNGLKQSLSKLGSFKKLSHLPLFCPVCSKQMKNKLDPKMYQIHNKCVDCVAKFETQLKLDGKYEEYAKNMIQGNINHYLNEYEQFLDDISRNINTSFVSEDGVVEQWVGDNKQQIQKAKEQLDDIKRANTL